MEHNIPSWLKKKNLWVIIIVILVLFTFYKLFENHSRNKGIIVEAASVSRTNIAPYFESVGTTEANNSVDIKSQVAGQISSIPVNPGQEVQQNQLLMVIDPRPFQAQVDQAKANLLKDQVAATNAVDELTRYETLLKKGYISKEYFDQIKSNAESAKATVQADQATLKTVELQLSHTQISAPISGRLSDINLNQGDLVTIDDTTPLMTINQFKPINVSFSMPAQNLPAILEASKLSPLLVTVVPDADKTYHTTGALSFINNQIDETTGTVTMKASLPNADERLWPGEFVRITLILPSLMNALVIPTIAIQQDQQQKYYVYVIDSQHRAHVRKITIGPVQGDKTSILSGLSLGEKVITKGQFEITDGSLVQP